MTKKKTEKRKPEKTAKRRSPKVERPPIASTEEALWENEANLTALVENSNDRIWAVDADYRLIVRNPQFLQGVREELKRDIALGESVLLDSLPQAAQDEWRSYYDRGLRGESFSVEKETQFYKEPAFIHYRFHPIRSAEGKISGVVVSGRDITERKKAEKKIQNLAKFPSENPNPVLRIARDGLLLYVNEAGLRQLAEFHLQVGQAAPPMLREVVFQAMENGSEQVLDLEYREQLHSFFVTPVVDAGYANLYGLDITERKRAEAELIEREAFNFVLFEYNPIQTVVVDLEGKVIKSNLAKKKSGDRLPNIGDTMYKDYAGKHKIDMYEELMKCIRSGEEKEFPEQKYGDRVLSITISPFPKGAVIISEDITERKRAEEALRESEVRYKELWERAPVAYHVLDLDGIIAKVNQTEASMLGYQVHEMVGKSIFDFILPEQRDEAQKRFCQKIQGLPIPRIENRIYLKKDGSRIYVVIDDVLERDAHKKITGIRSTMTDITDRKRIEEELIKSEKKYRSLVQTAGSGIAAMDQRGIFTFVNKTLCRMCGYPEQELIGKHFVDFLHPDDRKNAIQIFENAFINPIENPYIEFRIIHKDGHIVYMCSNPTAFEYEGQLLGFNAIILDITERKRAEEALRESEERYRRLVETAPEVIYNLSAKDGTITLLNLAFERITGWSRAEWLGKPFMPLVHPDDLTLAMGTFQHVSRGEPTPPYELRILSKSGEYLMGEFTSFPHIEKRKVIGEFGIVRDITERRKAEEALRESQKRFQALTETTSDFVWEMDANGVYTYCSPQINELWGYKPEDMIGRTPFDLMIPEDRERAIKMFRKMSESQSPFKGMETSNRDNTGRIVVLETSGVPFFDIDGRLRGYRGISRDITERKRADNELRKSEAKLKEAQALGRIGSWEFDLDSRTIQWSDQVYRLYERDPAIGPPSVEEEAAYYSPEQAGILREYAQIAGEQGQAFEYYLEARLPSGRIAHFAATMRPVRDKSGRIVKLFGTVQDITERKRAEEAVRESEEKYRGLTENINLGIYRNTVGPEGQFIEANPAIIRMSGYKSKEEFLAINVSDLYQNPEDRNKFNDKMLKEGFVRGEELRLKKKDGSLYVGSVSAVAVKDEQGHVKYYDGIIEDITERKRVEDALRFTRLSLDNAADTMVCVGHDARFVDVNDAFCRSLGYSREELLSKTVHDIDPNYSAEVWPEFWKKLKQSGSLNFETCHYTKAGKAIPVEITAKFFEYNGKEYHCGFARDITERKRAEEEIRQKAKDLQEKNAELTRFIYAVSHDLRSPLVTIQTFQGHLEGDIRSQDAARVEKDLGYIRNAADKMGRLLNELLRFSRVGRIMNPSEEAPLQAIVKEALDLVAGRITGRGVQIDLTEEPVVLYGDRTRLVEVFLNLVDNAVKFMGDEPMPRVEIGVEQAGEELVLHVRDNGIGIDPRLQPMLFGLFHKLDPETEGEGIGLALVKQIVELHGGRIWVESAGIGTGATFRFTLAKTRSKRGREETE